MKQSVFAVLVTVLLCSVDAQSGGNETAEAQRRYLSCKCELSKDKDVNFCLLETMKQFGKVNAETYMNLNCTDETPLPTHDMSQPGQMNNTVPNVTSSSTVPSAVPDSTLNPGRTTTTEPSTTKADQTENSNGSVTEPDDSNKSSTEGVLPDTPKSSTSSNAPSDPSSSTEMVASSNKPALTSNPDLNSSETKANSTEEQTTTSKTNSSDAVDKGSDHLAWSIPLICILLIAMGVGGYFIFRYTKKAGYLQQTSKSSVNGDSTKKTTEPV